MILAQAAQKEKLMKKYRLTKITVRTREMVAMSKNAEIETQISVCPICHSPVSQSLPIVGTNFEKQLTELPPAEVSNKR